jgi:hypothetical protein
MSSHGIPLEIFAAGDLRWLGVQPQGQPEKPRVMLMSVPYALKARDAETVGGKPASAFALVPGSNGGSGLNSVPAVPAGTITGSGTAGHIAQFTGKTTIGNSAIFQNTTGIGIGTIQPTATLDVNGASNIRNTLTLFPNGSANTLAISNTNFKIDSTGNVTFIGTQKFPGTGTITGVAAGAGLTGGGTSGKVTLSVPSSGITNAMLQNPSLTVTANSPLTGGGLVSLGGSTSLGLTTSCSAGQVLQWNGTAWVCATSGNGTITGVTAGTDLTGGGTNGNVTLNVDTTKVVTGVVAGTDLTGGGTGGVQTLNVDTTKIPQLNTANTFTGNQTVNGNLNATGIIAGSSFEIGSNLFAFGSFTNQNAFLGFAGNTTMTGADNTGSGQGALVSNTTGNSNTASGIDALKSNTTGNNNTGSGQGALGINTTGSFNTALGYLAGPDSNSPNLTNATAIGANATVSESNALVLGGTGSNAVSVGIGTATPQYTLDVHGTGNFTQPVIFAPNQVFPGTGTVTSVGSGAGLVGGPITSSGTLSIATGGVTNAMLQNSTLTVSAGTDLTGGGAVALGSSTTLNLDTTKVPQLNANNTFNGNQTVNGALSSNSVFANSISANSNSSQFSIYGLTTNTTNLSAGTAGQALGGSGMSFGVSGLSNSSSGAGVYGVEGRQSTTGANSSGGAGVWGDAGNLGNFGIFGTADSAHAILALNNGQLPTVYAQNNTTQAQGSSVLAAIGTYGNCVIDVSGNLKCTGSKSAVVPVDGGLRKVALYAVEAPENWFEDVGSGRLSVGSARIALEQTFAQTINPAMEYHVFLTPKGDCEGLYVDNETSVGFEVHELHGGRSNVAFDYRVMAHRKGYESIRLADTTEEFSRLSKRILGQKH